VWFTYFFGAGPPWSSTWYCRRRRAIKVRRYASCRYVQSQFFDESVDITTDMAFINPFQEFAFDLNQSGDMVDVVESRLICVQRRPSSLSAHEDALRVATTLPRKSSSHVSVDHGQRSIINNNNNNNKVSFDAVVDVILLSWFVGFTVTSNY